MSDRNQLPQSSWNLPPGVSESDPYFTDESPSICPGYGELECGNEKDYDKDLCEDCQQSADLDAKEQAEAELWRDGRGDEIPEPDYPHLTDRE